MNKTLLTLGSAGLALSVFLTGCRSGGEKNDKTMWSIPSVKLSRSGEKEVVRPAEKANADATAKLANERLNGHNPSVAVRDTADASLHPDPEEIASLSRLEGSKVPDWADGGLPPAPESTADTPAMRIAGGVNDEMLNTAKAAPMANVASLSDEPISTKTASISGAVPPEALPGPVIRHADTTQANSLANTPANTPANVSELAGVGPTVTTGASGSSADIYNGELPASLDDLPTQLSPVGGPVGVHQVGATMLELPENGSQIPTVAQNSKSVQASAEITAENRTTTSENQPAALFMPGNINPNYPNTPVR